MVIPLLINSGSGPLLKSCALKVLAGGRKEKYFSLSEIQCIPRSFQTSSTYSLVSGSKGRISSGSSSAICSISGAVVLPSSSLYMYATTARFSSPVPAKGGIYEFTLPIPVSSASSPRSVNWFDLFSKPLYPSTVWQAIHCSLTISAPASSIFSSVTSFTSVHLASLRNPSVFTESIWAGVIPVEYILP